MLTLASAALAGMLGLTGCAAGYAKVAPADACRNGALFECNPQEPIVNTP